MPLAKEQFFYWRNQPLLQIHGAHAIYDMPSEELIEHCARTPSSFPSTISKASTRRTR
jgi:hypothetical protein